MDDVLEAREDPRSVAQLKQLTGVEVLWAHVPGAVDIPGPQRPLPLGDPHPAGAGFGLHVVTAGEDEEMVAVNASALGNLQLSENRRAGQRRPDPPVIQVIGDGMTDDAGTVVLGTPCSCGDEHVPPAVVLEDEGVPPVLGTGGVRLLLFVPPGIRLQRLAAGASEDHAVVGVGPADTLHQAVLRSRDTGVEDPQRAIGSDDGGAGPDGLVVEGRAVGVDQGVGQQPPAARVVGDGVAHGGAEVPPLRIVQRA